MAASKFAVPDIGGHDVILVSMIPPKYKCPFCNLLMRDPIQTYRGEMSCESCYVHNKGNDKVCPIDKEPIEDGEYFKDNHAKREIQQLECYCANKVNGCPWKGVICDIKKHSPTCEYKKISCEKCNDHVLRKDIDDHVKETCRFRIIKCRYCLERYDAQSLQEHESVCHFKPMDCPYLCGEHIAMTDLYSHVQNCAKVAAGNCCPYQIVGCKYQPKSNADMREHLLMDTSVHAAFTVSLVKHLQQTNEKLRNDIMSEQTLRRELATQIETDTNEKSAMADEVNKIQDKLYEVQKECSVLNDKCDNNVKKVENDLKEIDLRTQERSLRDIDHKLTEIGKQYNELQTKLNSGPAGGNTDGGTFNPEEIKEGMAKIDKLESGSAVLSANLSDLELKLQLLENTCYEGQQLWKVDNVSYRMNQAVTGKVTALHSAPCFQKRGGYKFCSRLYLNGDGMGRGTHVSLFFVVMKSEYDALLQWPFSERVTFRLINPYDREESIQESFIPDKNSSSFKRPTKDMNIAAGCPMFIKRENLQNFIVDDVLYIETVISSENIH